MPVASACPPIPSPGLVAHTLVETLSWGPVAPFDAAAAVLAVGGAIILTSWTENYGDASEHGSATEGFKKAAQLIWSGALERGEVGFAACSMPSVSTLCFCSKPAGPAATPADGFAHMRRAAPRRVPMLQSRRLRCWAPCSRFSRDPCTRLSSCGLPPSGDARCALVAAHSGLRVLLGTSVVLPRVPHLLGPQPASTDLLPPPAPARALPLADLPWPARCAPLSTPRSAAPRASASRTA
jgi:hypothetical protein